MMRDVTNYLRENPQALLLLIICVVLGIGTFIAVMVALVMASPGTTTGDPEGAVLGSHAFAAFLTFAGHV